MTYQKKTGTGPLSNIRENRKPADFGRQMKQYGIPEGGIWISNIFGATIRHNDMDQIDPALETLLGRKPGSLENYLKGRYS